MQTSPAAAVTTRPLSCNSFKDDLSRHCLLIKHSDGWRDDRCERWLQNAGYTTHTCISEPGTRFPDASCFSRVVIYGGMPCVNDAAHTHNLQRELEFLESVFKLQLPCFGICLGAQLIAHALGAEVKPLPCGTTEFGFSTIRPTQRGAEFMPQPCKMLQWHSQGFELPTDSELLATGSVFPNQAFRHGKNTYAVQFHPEVTTSVLRHWHTRHNQDSRLSGSKKQRAQQLLDCHRYARENDEWLNHFMQLWISQ